MTAGNGNGHEKALAGLKLTSFVDRRRPVGLIEILDDAGDRKKIEVFRLSIGSIRSITNATKAAERGEADAGDLVDAFRAVVTQCCPGMTDTEADALEEDEVGEIIKIAKKDVAEMEKALPKQEEPENPRTPAGQTPRARASSRSTRSST